MAKKKTSFGNKPTKFKAMRKGVRDSADAGLMNGGGPNIGQTLHPRVPTHPAVAAAKPVGAKRGSKAVPDKKLVAPHTKRKAKKP